jgi:hypothetical protein
VLGDGAWHPASGVLLEGIRPELDRIQGVVASVFELFGSYAVVLEASPSAVRLRCRQIGGSKFQTLLHAALVRQIGMQWPGGYVVTLTDTGTPTAHIRVEPSAALLAEIRGRETEA